MSKLTFPCYNALEWLTMLLLMQPSVLWAFSLPWEKKICSVCCSGPSNPSLQNHFLASLHLSCSVAWS